MTAVSITTVRRTGILEKLIQEGKPFELSIRGKSVCKVIPNQKKAPKRIVMKIDDKHKILIPKNYDPNKPIPELDAIPPIRTGFSTRQRTEAQFTELSN
jgi:hypothetical protein